MPTNGGLPTDPEQFLRQMQDSPAAGPTSTPEADAYADRGAQEAIAQYLWTGQMPATQRNYAGGPIAALGQLIGLTPKEIPVTSYTQARAGLLKQGLTEQEKARKLAEMQAVAPMAMQFGGKFGQRAMNVVDPSLSGAFDPSMMGKGEIAEQQSEWKSQVAQKELELKQMVDQGIIDAKQAQIAATAMRAEAAQAQASASEERAGTAGEEANLKMMQFESAPERQLWDIQMKNYTSRYNALQKERAAAATAVGVAPADRKAALDYIDAELQKIQEAEQNTVAQMMGGGRKGRGASAATPPPKATTPPPTLGPTAIKRGLFD